jgi:ribosomal protein S18 acetylase RimI-like enzyme
MPSADPLHNVFWHAFDGDQRRFTIGNASARRYAPGLSPILAFRDAQAPDFDAAAALCGPQEKVYVSDWEGALPAGWSMAAEARMLRMVWGDAAPPPDTVDDALPLQPGRDADAAVALAQLTQPGPFGPRTLELGDYLGVWRGGRLLAMAGERLQAGALREVSGVATHPDAQGRGLARGLMAMLMRRQLARGQRPMLHVMEANTGARRLYERMGFGVHATVPVRVVMRLPD